jgi:hypothetical protein
VAYAQVEIAGLPATRGPLPDASEVTTTAHSGQYRTGVSRPLRDEGGYADTLILGTKGRFLSTDERPICHSLLGGYDLGSDDHQL